MAIDTTSPRTRRAILLGALGGVAASVAAAVGRANPVGATNGDVVHVGHTYSATSVTRINANDSAGPYTDAFIGSSVSGDGITGRSDSGLGVKGVSLTGDAGVWGQSEQGHGVHGTTRNHIKTAVYGQAIRDSTGVMGHSGNDFAPSVFDSKTGVWGYANQDTTSIGVKGHSPQGRGVVAVGGKAQLRLVPTTRKGHPVSGAAGDLYVNGATELWFCKGDTEWVQII